MTPVTHLPALAAAATGGLLVGNRRGRVVHIARPGTKGLTATGRLRRGAAPLCGQRARTWRQWPVDGRPLCRRCARYCQAARTVDLPRDVRARLLADTLATVRDSVSLAAARLAVCAGPAGQVVDGRPLHRHVAAAQQRLTPAPVSTAPFPATRRPLRRAAARDRFAALVDLPGGTT